MIDKEKWNVSINMEWCRYKIKMIKGLNTQCCYDSDNYQNCIYNNCPLKIVKENGAEFILPKDLDKYKDSRKVELKDD